MGAISTSLMCGRKPILVNLIGLDGAGKTTILYKYKLGFDKPFLGTIHTIGFNIEIIKYKNFSFQVTDFGGGDKIQPLFNQHFKDRPILIFVIDSSDREHVQYSTERLDQCLSSNDVDDVLLLVFANKQDLPVAMTVPEIIDQYKLKALTCRWHVQPCVAITGEGVCDGFEWLLKNM